MLRRIIVIISILLVAAPVYAQAPDTLWTKTYGGEMSDYGNCVQETCDGGFIIAGSTASNSAGTGDVYLIKTDSFGDTIWTRKYGGEYYDGAKSVQQTGDGGYILTGITGTEATYSNLYLVKTDESGDTTWTRIYPDYQSGECVRQTNDGGYIAASTSPNYYAVLMKTDANGDLEWLHTYDEGDYGSGYSVEQTTDGGYIMTGTSSINYYGETDVLVIKTGSGGELVWRRRYGTINVDYGFCVVQDLDGGYVVTGLYDSHPEADSEPDIYLIKMDADGDSLWTRNFGRDDDDRGNSLLITSDGGYIITGAFDVANPFVAGGDLGLLKIDNAGNEEWSISYGESTANDMGNCIQHTSDGGLVVVGSTRSYGAGLYDIWLLRFEGDFNAITESDYSSPGEFELYPPCPNPFNATTAISFKLQTSSQVELKLYDITGRSVGAFRETPLQKWYPAGYHEVVWDAAGMSSGVYFVRLEAVPATESRHHTIFTQTRKLLLIK